MRTFKNLDAFRTRLERGMNWGDWIKVGGREYKMVEYGDGYQDNYMLFQNRPTRRMIEVRYKVPTKRADGSYTPYELYSIDEYENGTLYRYQ